LTNVRVIAIDQEMGQGAAVNNTAAGKLVHTVTLAVDPEQAQKIAVATHIGKLSLTIRPASDNRSADEAVATFGSDVSPVLGSAVSPTGKSMQVLNGNDTKEVKFR
jgi:pilus assembly protein CpaB